MPCLPVPTPNRPPAPPAHPCPRRYHRSASAMTALLRTVVSESFRLDTSPSSSVVPVCGCGLNASAWSSERSSLVAARIGWAGRQRAGG